MVKYAVLGLGLMGSVICFDLLSNDHSSEVLGFDRDQKQREAREKEFNSFENRFQSLPLILDLKDNPDSHDLKKILIDNDISVAFGAIDYKYNYWLSKLCIQAGVSFIDLGGNPSVVQNQRSLDKKAQEAEVTIVLDLGLAPGMINTFKSSYSDELEEVSLASGNINFPITSSFPFNTVILVGPFTNKV